MMLIVGLVPVLFLVLAVGIDAAVLFAHRRALSATADSAALAAAQAADLERIYTQAGPVRSLPLDCPAARRAAQRMLEPGRTDARAAAAVIESVECDGTNVAVNVRAVAELPIAHALGVAPQVIVRGRAVARSPLR